MDERLKGAQDMVDAAHVARDRGLLDEAEALFRRAVEAAPNEANPLHNLATVLQLKGDHREAERLLRNALDIDPSRLASRAALGIALLAQGHLNDGFSLFDAWRNIPGQRGAPGLPFPRWRGQDVAGKRLLIWSEEGLGDQIMYARFAAVLKKRGAEVTWLCPPSLQRLLAAGLGITALPSDQSVDLSGFDFYSPSSSLPLGFNLTPETIPGAPYLSGLPTQATDARIGVVTQGNPAHINDRNRSLPDALGSELLKLPGAVNLAPEATGARDFHDTASLIAGLDLVISVDTSVAHLAGAMGKPIWILLPAVGVDWRWLQDRSDSPWYPTAHLYRQTNPSWTEVVGGVYDAAMAAAAPVRS